MKPDSSLLRRFKWSYGLALVLVSIAVVSEFLLAESLLTEHGEDAQIVNVAGRQRMLTQRITKLTLLNAIDEGDKSDEVFKTLQELLTQHKWLVDRLSGAPEGDTLAALRPRVNALSAAVTLALDGDANMAFEVDRIADEVLHRMDELVQSFSVRADASTQFVSNLKRWLAGATLLLVLLEFRFIFRPTLRHLRIQLSKLNQALDAKDEVNDLLLANAQKLNQSVQVERATAADLKRSEARYKGLFEHAFDGIVIADASTGEVLEVNQAMRRSLGLEKGTFPEAGPFALSPEHQPDGRASDCLLQNLHQRLADGEVVTSKWSLLDGSGELVDYNLTAYTLSGSEHLYVAVFSDVSERNRAQHKLEAANHELRTFAHVASHDLKEPLRTMASFADLVVRRNADSLDQDSLTYLGFITDAGKRGTQLVDDLLEFAEAGKSNVSLSEISLNQVAATVHQHLRQRLAECNGSLVLDPLPAVVATETWARQLLQNLASNALKFARPGVAPAVRVTATSTPTHHAIAVSDNGIGMAEQDVPRVFDSFERLVSHVDYEGSGIGLATCRRIMQQLNGEITVESELGKGTTFTLLFPKAVEERENTRPASSLVHVAERR